MSKTGGKELPPGARKRGNAGGDLIVKIPEFGINNVKVYTQFALTLGRNGDMIQSRCNL